MDIKGKNKFCENFIENIFTIKQFEKNITNYSNYKLKLLEFIKNIYNVKKELLDKSLRKIQKQITKNPIYDLLSEILPYDDIIKIFNINDDIVKSINNMFIDYKEIINHEIKNYLDSLEILNHIKDKTKAKFIKTNIIDIINLILDKIEYYEFNIYKNKINLDINMVNILSNELKTDIYFIDSTNRLPFKYNKEQIYKNKKGIILLKIQNSYETIGLLLDDNKVKREFEYNHFLLKKINTYLFDTNKIPSKYPELLQYLEPSKKVKNKYILSDKDSDKDSSSDIDREEDEEDKYNSSDDDSDKDRDDDSDKDSDDDRDKDSDDENN